MRRFRSTLVLLAVFLGLAGYVYFYELQRPADEGEDKPRAFTVESGDIAELWVRAETGETTRLTRESDGESWRLTEPVETAADTVAVDSMADSLAGLEVQRVVDEAPTDIEQYGLASPRIEVSFRLTKDTTETRLQLGDATPTGGQLYAKTAADPSVFLVSSFLESTFNKTPFDLRDKAVLTFERDTVQRVELEGPDGEMAFIKDGPDWRVAVPLTAAGDYTTIEGLVGQLQSTRMTALTAETAEDLSQYGLDTPRLSATVVLEAKDSAAEDSAAEDSAAEDSAAEDGGAVSRLTLDIGGDAPDGGMYARDRSRSPIFTVSSAFVDSLARGVDEYRRKDIFAFRPFNATHLEVTRDNGRLVFEKPEGTDDEPAVWTQVTPANDAFDSTELETVLSALSTLRAESFVGGDEETGQAVLTVAVTFGEGMTESVTFSRVGDGDDVLAVRAGEPGAARIAAAAFDNATTAIDALDD